LCGVCLKPRDSATFKRPSYTVNVLAHDQVELARRFPASRHRFAGIAVSDQPAGRPLIEGCVAWFECRHCAQHRTGDHLLFIGEVESCEPRNGVGLVSPRSLCHHASAAERKGE
jgi:flavin reductase (DIM6/NTAB) family NADH-FMN oxidoreductase RutF